jgi:methionyl-tRNA formyltransferase
MIAQGNIVTTPQEEGDYPRAPKIFREDCQINWEQPAGVVRNFIRGLSPYPGAYTDFAGKQLKVFRCIIEPATDEVPPGQMQTDYSSYIKYRATDGWVSVTDIQWHGKKRMETSTFLRGYRP